MINKKRIIIAFALTVVWGTLAQGGEAVESDIPAGSPGLNKQAVINYSKELYRLDGELSFQRAELLGSIIRSLNTEQRAYLDKMAAGNSLSWSDLPDQVDKKSYSKEEHVAVMTYARVRSSTQKILTCRKSGTQISCSD